MGHVIRMANYIVDFGKQGKNATKIQQLQQELPDELKIRWPEFVETKVAPANRNNEIIPITVGFMINPCLVFRCLMIVVSFHFPVKYGSTESQFR